VVGVELGAGEFVSVEGGREVVVVDLVFVHQLRALGVGGLHVAENLGGVRRRLRDPAIFKSIRLDHGEISSAATCREWQRRRPRNDGLQKDGRRKPCAFAAILSILSRRPRAGPLAVQSENGEWQGIQRGSAVANPTCRNPHLRFGAVPRVYFTSLTGEVPMSKICAICGKGPSTGNTIIRQGLAKYKGGIGLHTTGISRRRFLPNLQRVRVKAGGSTTRVLACAKCLKQGRVVKA
jgi:large subunit ribosomal protein L28